MNDSLFSDMEDPQQFASVNLASTGYRVFR